MRIGFDVAPTCIPRSGCSWYADSLARALIQVAPEHDYFLYHQFGNWLNRETEKGIVVEHPSVRSPFWGMSREVAQEAWSVLAGKELPGNPDIVQSNSFQVVPTGRAKLVVMIYDVSFWVCPEFTTESNRLECQAGVLQAISHADGLLFISESGRREFETILPGYFERSKQPAVSIPLGSRLQGIGDHRRAESFWLAVGTLEPRKNYDAIFSALELYWGRSQRPLPLNIAGPGGWKNDKIKRWAEKLQKEGKVRLLGYIEDEGLQSLYQNAISLIFPSWYEGFGLPILEAMQNGCPVICSDCTSLPEVGGSVPIYVDPARPETIAEAMLQLETEPERRLRLSEAGRRRANKFSWERTARETLEFYQCVLDH